MLQVLYLDDEPALLDVGKAYLELSGQLSVDGVLSVDEAREAMRCKIFDAIVSDYQMPGTDGLMFLKELRSNGSNIPFILFTGKGREEMVIESLNTGADFYLQKGGDPRAQYTELEHKIKDAAHRRRVEQELIDISTRLRQTNRELLAIKEINKAIAHARTESELLNQTCRIMCETAGYVLAWVGVAEDDKERSITPVAWAGSDEDYVLNVKASWADVECGRGPTGMAIRTGRTVANQDVMADAMYGLWKERAARRGFASSIAIPLVVNGKVIGALMLYSKVRGHFDLGEIALLEEMTQELSFGIASLRTGEEKRKAEAALIESEQMYRSLVHMANVGVVIIQDNSICLSNPYAVKLTGYTEEESVSIPFINFVHPDDRAMVLEQYARRLADDHVPESLDLRIVRKDGEIRWVSANAVRITWKGRLATLNFLNDITDRKSAERMVEQSELKYRLLAENTSDVIWTLDIATQRFTYISPSITRLRGLTVEEAMNQSLQDSLSPEDFQAVMRIVGDSVAKYLAGDRGGRSVVGTFRQSTKSGGWVDVEVHATLFTNVNGNLEVLGVSREVSERVSTEEALRESEERIRLILDSTAEGIYGIDMEHRCSFANRSCLDMLGYSHENELLGKDMHSLIHSKHADGSPLPHDDCRVYQAVMRGEGSHVDDEVMWRSNGTPFPVEYWSYPQVRDGQVVGAVVTFLDITERKEVEHQMRERMKELRAFYHLSDIGVKKGLTIDQLCQEIAEILPASWQYPEITCVRVVYDGKEFRTANYHKTRWQMAAPIKKGDEEIGFVEVSYLEERPRSDVGPFMKEERDLLRSVADYLGEVIERLRIEEALRRINRNLSILNNISRHDISNQIMVLVGYLELCRIKATDPTLVADIQKMINATENIREQLAFTREYQELGVAAPTWLCISHTGDAVGHIVDSKDIKFEANIDGIEILADPLMMKVPYNLIDNSIRHGGKVTEIKLYAKQAGQELTIVYEDNGVGISAEDKMHLFEKGYGKNTGLGLFLIKEILAITGMTIRETGEVGKGARFEITVPPGAWRRAPSR